MISVFLTISHQDDQEDSIDVLSDYFKTYAVPAKCGQRYVKRKE